MEAKYAKDAVYLCRLMFGQAVLELLADEQQVSNAALQRKVRAMLPDAQPALIYNVAMEMLNNKVS